MLKVLVQVASTVVPPGKYFLISTAYACEHGNSQGRGCGLQCGISTADPCTPSKRLSSACMSRRL